MPKPEKPERLDRHSGSGTRGLAKKEGAGKFGWGTAGDDDAGPIALDRNDPLYEDPEDLATVAATTTDQAKGGLSVVE